MDMSDDEIAIFLRDGRPSDSGIASTSTPATNRTVPMVPRRPNGDIDDVAEFCASSGPTTNSHSSTDPANPDLAARLLAADNERHAVEARLRALELRQQETISELAEERGRRKACQELLEMSAILAARAGPDPAPRPVPLGPVPT